MNNETITYGQGKCPKCGGKISSSIHDKCACDEERQKLLKEIVK